MANLAELMYPKFFTSAWQIYSKSTLILWKAKAFNKNFKRCCAIMSVVPHHCIYQNNFLNDMVVRFILNAKTLTIPVPTKSTMP
jgi:hypothetical protein